MRCLILLLSFYDNNLLPIIQELLENFANIIAQVAVQQFVTKMTDNVRGEETLH